MLWCQNRTLQSSRGIRYLPCEQDVLLWFFQQCKFERSFLLGILLLFFFLLALELSFVSGKLGRDPSSISDLLWHGSFRVKRLKTSGTACLSLCSKQYFWKHLLRIPGPYYLLKSLESVFHIEELTLLLLQTGIQIPILACSGLHAGDL
jgi:hypothetical protein